MLFCAFQCIAIQDMKKPAELDFMRVCGLCWGVGWEGLEPSTNALKGHCLQIEIAKVPIKCQ